MFYTGKKENGHFYLAVDGIYVEVSEDVYYAYMREEWKEKKAYERASRCYDWGAGRRCRGDCEHCDRDRNGGAVSLDGLMEDSEFDIADTKRKSVEDTVIMKLLIEALYEAVDDLPSDEQFLIEALYLFDDPLSQEQVAIKLRISQQAVSKKVEKALNALHEALKDWED